MPRAGQIFIVVKNERFALGEACQIFNISRENVVSTARYHKCSVQDAFDRVLATKMNKSARGQPPISGHKIPAGPYRHWGK